MDIYIYIYLPPHLWNIIIEYSLDYLFDLFRHDDTPINCHDHTLNGVPDHLQEPIVSNQFLLKDGVDAVLVLDLQP
jgi:hypothetical protein